MVKEYSLKRDGELKLQPNFKVKEFRSQDGDDKILIDDGLVRYLQALRDCLGLSSLNIVSGYRSAAYNKSIGGANKSQHLTGKAADVCGYKNGRLLDPKYLCCAAEVLGMDGIALIQTCAHLDVRGYRTLFDENRNDQPISKFGHNSWFTYCGVTDLSFMENPFLKPKDAQETEESERRYIQFELIRRGFLPLTSTKGKCNVDGIVGTNTKKAIEDARKWVKILTG